jgi:hypothetical protein
VSDARGALVDLLYGERPAALAAAYGVGEHFVGEKDADAILALHAHELAEKIRAWAREPLTDAGAPEYGSVENVLDAANLIDPEVSSNG